MFQHGNWFVATVTNVELTSQTPNFEMKEMRE